MSDADQILVCCFSLLVLFEGKINQYLQGNKNVCVPVKYPRSQMLEFTVNLFTDALGIMYKEKYSVNSVQSSLKPHP